MQRVSPRIEEILLQQQVNLLFDEWLTNLRKQGDVEVLDPALESAEAPAPTQPHSPAPQTNPSANLRPGREGKPMTDPESQLPVPEATPAPEPVRPAPAACAASSSATSRSLWPAWWS